MKKFSGLPQKMAFLSYSIPIAADVAKQYATLFQKAGASICYTNYGISPAPGASMGSVVEYPYSKPITASSESTESITCTRG